MKVASVLFTVDTFEVAARGSTARNAETRRGVRPLLAPVSFIGYKHTSVQHRSMLDTEVITQSDVTAGVAAARRRIGALVYEPALAGISDVDRSFLTAIAQDSGPSKMADVCTCLGVNANYGSQYRFRLTEAGLVEGLRYGEADFVKPLLREYLQERAVTSTTGLATSP